MSSFNKEFKEIKIYSAVLWYIFTIFIVIIIASIMGTLMNNKDLLKNDNLLSLISTSLFIIILLYKFKVNKNKLYLMIKDYLRKINLKEICSVVATQLCLSMGISLLLIGLVYFLFPHTLNKLLSQSSVSESSSYGGLLISMLITVIGAPLMEELFFRAVIFKRISRKFNIYIGMILSSLIFGLLHIDLAIIGAFVFGIACCILYIKYKNILIPMTVHFLNNLLAFLPQLNMNSQTDSSPMNSADAKYSLVFGLILFSIGMIFFIKFIKNNKKYLKNGFNPRIDNKFSFENMKYN